MVKTPEIVFFDKVEHESDQNLQKHQKEYCRENEVFAMTRIKLAKLRNNRYQMNGLPYIKTGKSFLYRRKDITENINAHLISPKC
ncbi:MAG: hypothetical protein HOD92_09060 [Deltaproteobacteria bacterium]|jgi:hypothetical protein|nr:hypothetical protein [Deltaproteobacteria bacterium]